MMTTPKELAAIVIAGRPKRAPKGPSDLEGCMQDFISAFGAKDAKGMAQAFEAAMLAGPMESEESEEPDGEAA
jgi:hypothetical protein